MSLTIDAIACSSLVCEDFNKTGQDPIIVLPEEIVLKIFSLLNLATLGTICSVSKNWGELASKNPLLWKAAIYKERAFGNDKWAQHFGEDSVKNEKSGDDFSSLPLNDFIADCKNFKSIFPEKNAKDTLMLVRFPKTLNGRFTLKSLGELAKTYFPSHTGYKESEYEEEDGYIPFDDEKSIDKSHWVQMTKDVLPESRNKSYNKQRRIITKLPEKSLNGYKVPTTLEAAACILSQYFDSNILLFSDAYTHCEELAGGLGDEQMAVGGFDSTGLDIDCFYQEKDHSFGVAAIRAFDLAQKRKFAKLI